LFLGIKAMELLSTWW